MDLETYKELTGQEVPASKEAKLKATIRRTKSYIESMLGYSLTPKNLYTEAGKTRFEGYLPIITEDMNLLEPDEEEGIYKLFPYNEVDKYLHVDPFTNMYKVKLVTPYIDGEFITVADLDNVVPAVGRDGISKYIERHWEWFTWEWYRTWRYSYTSVNDTGLMLAVDADWVTCYPDDLMYLWADMIEYKMNPNSEYSSESVDGHSWSRTKESQESPEKSSEAKKILTRYAGPYGKITRIPTR